MATQCYAQVRGSVIRVTALDRRGHLPAGPIVYAVSKSVARVTVNEITEDGSNEIQRNEDADERRLHLITPAQTIRYSTDIDFLCTEPGILSLVAGVPLVYKGSEPDLDNVVGFDSRSKVPPVAFALEIWSKLAGVFCATRELGFGEGDFGGMDFGESVYGAPAPQWGYTLFPFLKGGLMSGFAFANGAVTFNLRRAQTRRGAGWGYGPYDINGPFERLVTPVSGNTNWRNTLVSAPPPLPTDGIASFNDIIDGGTATMTSSDVLDGGTATLTTSRVVDGGRA